jgi:hypothetical protein
MPLRLRPVGRADLDTLERWSADPEAQGHHDWSRSAPDGQPRRRFEQDGLLGGDRGGGFHDMVVDGRLRGDRPSQV